jgi:hypothetical protein
MAVVTLADEMRVTVNEAGQHRVPGQLDDAVNAGKSPRLARGHDRRDPITFGDDGVVGKKRPRINVEEQAWEDDSPIGNSHSVNLY